MELLINEIISNSKSQLKLLSSLVGFLSQLVFKRYEPSLPQFTLIVLSIFTISLLGPTTLVTGNLNLQEQLDASSLIDSITYTGIYLTSLLLGILYYRIISTSHPLHKIPGPWMAKASQLYIFRKVVNGQIRHDMTKLHEKYGDVARIGPNEVSVSYPEAILQIHGSKSWIRGTSYSVSTHSEPGAPEDHVSLLGLREHSTHTPRRRLWDRAFQMSALKDYRPMVLSKCNTLVEQFDKRSGASLDLYDWLGLFVWDITAGLAFGGGNNMLEEGDPTGIRASLNHSMHFQGQLMVLPWIAPLARFIPMAQKTEAFRVFATRLFLTRKKDGSYSGDKDVFHYLLADEPGQKPLTLAALGGDSSLVIAGGADTTRTVLTLLFMHLLREPQLFKRLQKDIDDAVRGQAMDLCGVESFPTHEALKGAPIIEAMINETLRINPPIPFEHVRDAPFGGADLKGFSVPEGTKVRCASNAIQRDPRNFTDPLVFRPDRWLDPDNEKVFNKAAFFPFLFGAFHCPGKSFAYQEMRIVIATLAYKYDIEFAPGFDSFAWEGKLRDNGSLLEIDTPLMVVLKRRKSTKN